MQIPSLQQLLEAGVHFGHQVRRSNPRMRPYIYGAKEGVHIIDLTLSEAKLKEACQFVEDLGKSGGVLLLVGTKKQAKGIVEELAKEVEAPYLVERWIGGFLTNWDEISKNIKKLKELKEHKEKGELKKFTKKEQLLLDRKVIKLEKDFKGVLDLVSVPEAIFVVDGAGDEVAIREAARVGTAVVAIADSNADPSLVDYPIPGNDDAIKSIKILTETVIRAYGEGKKEAGKLAEKARVVEEKRLEKQAADLVDQQLAEQAAAAEEEVEKKALKDSERVVE